ncbi:MAG TPA: PHB depolymerase family esterase [Acidimicrobiia bacterium]|nr:PHB depolymerase family esterase [Acidimicrobiia bacterium]
MGAKGRWIAVGGVLAAAVVVSVGVAVEWRTTPPTPSPTVAATPATATASPAPPAPLTWVSTSEPLTVDGMARRYLLVRPATASKTPLPVVVLLHGRIVTPEFEEQRTGLPAVVGPAILVYPAGYQNSWNAGVCCAGAQAAGVDDVAFVTDVVHQVLATQHDAAGNRVFLVGFSNGGKMAFRLACAEPDLFDGVAVVGAVPLAPCAHPPALPFAEVAIDNDPLLTLTPAQPPKAVNGFPQASIEGEVATLRSANGCQGDGSRQLQGTLTTTRWADCRTGKPVELGLYQGNTHIWPAGDAATPSAGQVIWTFFRSIMEDHQ